MDDESRSDFAEVGTEPYGTGTVETALHLEVPDRVLGDDETFGVWIEQAVEAAG